MAAKEPRENLDFVQQAASDAMQLVQERFYIKTEETTDDQHLMFDLRTVNNEVSRFQEAVEYPVSLKETEDPVEVINLALLKQTIFLSLTSHLGWSWNRYHERKLSPLISLSTILRLERRVSCTRRPLILCVQRRTFK